MKRGLNPGKSLADKLQLLPKKVPRLIQENLDGIASPYLGNIVVFSALGQQDALGSEIISFLEAEGFALEAAPVYVPHNDLI